jgi:hypothetical protein
MPKTKMFLTSSTSVASARKCKKHFFCAFSPCSLLSQFSPLTLFERLLLGSKMNLQAASLCSPYAKVTIWRPFGTHNVRLGYAKNKNVFVAVLAFYYIFIRKFLTIKRRCYNGKAFY